MRQRMNMTGESMHILSIEDLAKLQKEIEDLTAKLHVEIARRAELHKVPETEVWKAVHFYRSKISSTDDEKPTNPAPLKGAVADVMEKIKARSGKQ